MYMRPPQMLAKGAEAGQNRTDLHSRPAQPS